MAKPITLEIPDLLTSREAAAVFGVDPATMTRWARERRVPSSRTPGGHRRFLASDVDALFNRSQPAERAS